MDNEMFGECFCGGISYKINSQLMLTQSCHCSRCRKAFSSQASAVGFLGDATFQWLSGEDLLTTYQNKEGVGIQFCKVCGSTISLVHNQNVVGITLGCLNRDYGIKIDRHLYVGSKAGWEKIPEGVKMFQAGPEQN